MPQVRSQTSAFNIKREYEIYEPGTISGHATLYEESRRDEKPHSETSRWHRLSPELVGRGLLRDQTSRSETSCHHRIPTRRVGRGTTDDPANITPNKKCHHKPKRSVCFTSFLNFILYLAVLSGIILSFGYISAPFILPHKGERGSIPILLYDKDIAARSEGGLVILRFTSPPCDVAPHKLWNILVKALHPRGAFSINPPTCVLENQNHQCLNLQIPRQGGHVGVLLAKKTIISHFTVDLPRSNPLTTGGLPRTVEVWGLLEDVSDSKRFLLHRPTLKEKALFDDFVRIGHIGIRQDWWGRNVTFLPDISLQRLNISFKVVVWLIRDTWDSDCAAICGLHVYSK
ncbi:hypothetical protein M422DRAFT_27335 [Sphaerobolus stellatus SS14]|nr:hypothetical protein M422DRAFT_27335 [Sphaerobolus stellatus SS14]